MIFAKRERPVVVAGPCSVESREQLRTAALRLSALPEVVLLRAGVWKPRTLPGGFEGLGEPALVWMEELQRDLGVRFCCEAARPEHVELCLKHGIGAVWIGARTTANPFMVSELCAALRGSGMSVLVKNPVCPDLRLWVGAVERVQGAGIADVAAVHRGFAMYRNGGYRNAPLWELALELRRELEGVPLLCDPSHMGGRRDLVAPLARTAMQMAYDGLMVEVHPRPDEALTDAAQQVTPDALEALLAALPSQKPSEASAAEAALAPLRGQIDDVDRELLRLLARRMELSRSIASIKRRTNTSVYQSARWSAVLDDRLRQAAELGLDADFVGDMLEKIHAESVRVQLDG